MYKETILPWPTIPSVCYTVLDVNSSLWSVRWSVTSRWQFVLSKGTWPPDPLTVTESKDCHLFCTLLIIAMHLSPRFDTAGRQTHFLIRGMFITLNCTEHFCWSDPKMKGFKPHYLSFWEMSDFAEAYNPASDVATHRYFLHVSHDPSTAMCSCSMFWPTEHDNASIVDVPSGPSSSLALYALSVAVPVRQLIQFA